MLSYQETKKEYKELFKKYPNVGDVWTGNEDEKTIDYTIKNYVKSGSRWTLTEEKHETINYIHFYNVVDPRATRFFRNLGGYDVTKCAYTCKGFLPVEVISINPDRTYKTVRTFKF